MRLLADESFPADAVTALRTQAHDVVWIRTDAPGTPDAAILSRAVMEDRILVTLDKDFGYLAFRAGLPASCGVILFRIRASSPARVSELAVAALASDLGWRGHFAVVEEDRIRLTPLPDPGDTGLPTTSSP